MVYLETNDNLVFIDILILFDTWLAMKIRFLLSLILRISFPLLQIACILTVGYTITFFYTKENSNVAQITDEKSISIIERFSNAPNKRIVSLETCNNYIAQYSRDTMLPNFASEASGALIIDTPDTTTYNDPQSLQLTMFGIPVWKAGYYTPRKVIQPWAEAGECWAFKGSQGKIIIEMAYDVVIEKVSLEHIPASAALTGKIDSAPKSFRVWGKVSSQYVNIGTFIYNDKGLFSQTFEIEKPEMEKVPIKLVMLEVLSNYGNPHYTCVYRFKIHGKIYSSPTQ